MLGKCANPACSATFRRLTDGRIFVIEVEPERSAGNTHQRQCFWLCNSCCRTMTVVVNKGKNVQIVPLDLSGTAVAS
jgi:hypothetical protein